MNKVEVLDLGLIDFEEAWKIQTEIHETLKKAKKDRNYTTTGDSPVHSLIICEHEPVYTLGKSGKLSHLKMNDKELKDEGIKYYKINRGGDITYHGPGQLVVYPIFDLDWFDTDVHWYVRSLEEVVIQSIAKWGLLGSRKKDFTGVWLEGHPARKICAIGVHLSRWITLHGLALNVQPKLAHFEGIIPCGIQDDDKAVTSIFNEITEEIDMMEVKLEIIDQFCKIFNIEIIQNKI